MGRSAVRIGIHLASIPAPAPPKESRPIKLPRPHPLQRNPPRQSLPNPTPKNVSSPLRRAPIRTHSRPGSIGFSRVFAVGLPASWTNAAPAPVPFHHATPPSRKESPGQTPASPPPPSQSTPANSPPPPSLQHKSRPPCSGGRGGRLAFGMDGLPLLPLRRPRGLALLPVQLPHDLPCH